MRAHSTQKDIATNRSSEGTGNPFRERKQTSLIDQSENPRGGGFKRLGEEKRFRRKAHTSNLSDGDHGTNVNPKKGPFTGPALPGTSTLPVILARYKEGGSLISKGGGGVSL